MRFVSFFMARALATFCDPVILGWCRTIVDTMGLYRHLQRHLDPNQLQKPFFKEEAAQGNCFSMFEPASIKAKTKPNHRSTFSIDLFPLSCDVLSNHGHCMITASF